MEIILYTLIASFLSVMAFLFYEKKRREFVGKMLQKLTETSDLNQFKNQLNSTKAKIFFPENARSLIELEGLFVMQDQAAVQEKYEKIIQKKANRKFKFQIQGRVFLFYVQQKNESKAAEFYEMLKESAENKRRMEPLLREYEYQLEIGVRKNGSYAEEMLEEAKINAGVKEGVYLYRAALCYYYQKDEEKTREYLEQSQELLKGTELEEKIRKIVEEDLSKIEEIGF